jgi:hypothetical protein
MARPAFELADIFRRSGDRYRSDHPMALEQLRVMRAIEVCRTATLGGHVEKCSQCDYSRIAYNSCRNRHCPKCQTAERAKWLLHRGCCPMQNNAGHCSPSFMRPPATPTVVRDAEPAR